MPSDHPALRVKRISTASFHLNIPAALSGASGPDGLPASVQIRHRMKAVSARVRLAAAGLSEAVPGEAEDSKVEGVVCDFDDPIVGVAPGQVAAVYFGERCVGSGVIEQTWSEVD